MNRRAQLLHGLLVLALLSPCFAREPWTLDDLKQRAGADAATPEGQAYLKQFFTNPWNQALESADEQCWAAQLRSRPRDEFVIALRIGSTGYPTDVLVNPDDDGMRCLADRLKATGFLRPPHDDFAIYIPYRRTEPGTENRPVAPVPAEPTKR